MIICFQGEFLQNKYVSPYAFAGGAFVFTGFKMGAYASIPEVKIEQRIENGLSFYFGFGARTDLTSKMSLFSEVSYLPRTASAKTIFTDMNRGVSSEDFEVNLRTIHLKFGLRYFF